MAYDVFRRVQIPGDWTMGDEPDASVPFIVTSSDADRIVDKAVSEEKQAAAEFLGARKEGKIDDATWTAFQDYRAEFRDWLASTGPRPYGYLKVGAVGIYKAAYEHRKRINDWRKVAAEKGAVQIGPKARDVDQAKAGVSPWAWVAAALGGAALFTLVQRR